MDILIILNTRWKKEYENQIKNFFWTLFNDIVLCIINSSVCFQKQLSEVFYENCCWSEAVVLKACNFIKKRLQHRCFQVNIAKFLRTPIFKNICKRLLLYFMWNHCLFLVIIKNTCWGVIVKYSTVWDCPIQTL